MKLIHLTDPHFVPPGQTLYGRDPSVALKRCLADINEHHADADLCVITGDLTHWGEPDKKTDCPVNPSELKDPPLTTTPSIEVSITV